MASHPLSALSARAPERGADAPPALSVIVPIFNEEESLPHLFRALFGVLDGMNCRYEVICIDDGSKDSSLDVLHAEAARNPRLKVVALRRNYGQTAAMMAGVDHATGECIVSIDADLQNDPADIPALFARLHEGYDVVSGWRKGRQDAAVRRVFVSRVANGLISALSGVKLRDYGCTLKAYRRDIIKNVRLYGEMHRFIPIYATWHGARVVEMPVGHHARKYGQSKYGLNRIVKVLLDLIVVLFLQRYFVKPIYVFGGFALFSMALGVITFCVMVYLRLFNGVYMIATPLPLLSAMMILVGVMSMLMGLLAEVMTRTYYESQNLTPYAVREMVNFDRPV